MKTIQECKDEVAKGFLGCLWDNLSMKSKIDLTDSVIELYASQFQQSGEVELPSFSEEEICAMFPMVSGCRSDISGVAHIRRDAVKWFIEHKLKNGCAKR